MTTGVTNTPDVAMALRSQSAQPPDNLLLGGQWPRRRFQLTSLHTQQPFCKSLRAIADFIRADVEIGVVPFGHWALVPSTAH